MKSGVIGLTFFGIELMISMFIPALLHQLHGVENVVESGEFLQ
jgi:hypothetical protein